MMTEDQLEQEALGWLASFGHTPLREGVELECKAAQGASGRGEVPKDFWPTYSAMANAHGGVVLLGVREKAGVFSLAGLNDSAKVRADLFNNLNNPGKVSANLLSDADVQELVLDGQALHYFSKENYYTQDEGLEKSEWFGQGAAALGLSGQIERQDFFEILNGKVDGKSELGSLYNPYWRVRLVSPTLADRTYAASKQGGLGLPS